MAASRSLRMVRRPWLRRARLVAGTPPLSPSVSVSAAVPAVAVSAGGSVRGAGLAVREEVGEGDGGRGRRGAADRSAGELPGGSAGEPPIVSSADSSAEVWGAGAGTPVA